MDDTTEGRSLDRQAASSIAREAETGVQERPSLVCFSHLRWDFVWQRPQHLLCRAARTYDVTFVEEPIHRPVERAHLHLSTRAGGVSVAVPVLPDGMEPDAAGRAQRDLVEELLADVPVGSRVFWYYTPMAVAFSAEIASAATIYDNMDELSAFRGASPELLAYEETLLARADLVFTGGLTLFEAKRGRHPRVHAFPSSIDFDHFAAARLAATAPLGDQAAIAGPRIGFFGVIDERMDVDLVAALADLRPHWQLVMIGPVVKIDPATLPQRANIHWLGPKSYDELPRYLAGWDAGFMPFALNEATRFISPTKTPEYLAAGLPLVSTPIHDVVRPYGQEGLVEIATDAGEMAARLDIALARPRTDWLARVDRHLSSTSWDLTWAEMERLIAARLRTLAATRDGVRSGPVLEAAG